MRTISYLLIFSMGPAWAAAPGAVELTSSDQRLVDGFRWAKKQALAYVSLKGDPVGSWYEASLPGRNAFCMRDVSHQATGAQVLGLHLVTRNMLHKFAENIAASRDWCSFWEIDKFNRPATVDYKSDRDFWYNLPANFDVLHTCYRQYLWTADRAYYQDPAFRNFYDKTVHEYVQAWDKDGDGVPESYTRYGHRGIGSYDEDLDFHVLIGADLVAAEAAAFRDYAEIQNLLLAPAVVTEFQERAQKLKTWFNEKWWDEPNQRFFRAMRQDRSFSSHHTEAIPEMWFDITEPGNKTARSLDNLSAQNVEVRSYLPEIGYRYGRSEWAYARLLELTDPQLARREYPEVSFAVVGAVAEGLMGVHPDGRTRRIETLSHLTEGTDWVALSHLPVFDNEIAVRHTGRNQTTVTNQKGTAFDWIATFPGDAPVLIVNGAPQKATTGRQDLSGATSFVSVRVLPGQTRTVRLP